MDKRTLFYWGKMYLENIRQGQDYMLTDVVEIHFLELPKFRNKKNKDYRGNDIERWLMFLKKDISETTLKELMSLDTAIEKAEQKI